MTCKLIDICELVGDTTSYSASRNDSYVSTENMIPMKGGITVSESIPSSGSVRIYHRNDVLISNIRPYFKKIWFADKCGTCSNDVLVFRAKGMCEPYYLFSLLSDDSFFNYVVSTSKGTKMPRGDKDAIMKYEFDEKGPEEQKCIASFVRSIDSLIEKNCLINDYLVEILRDVINDFFSSHDCINVSMYDIFSVIYGSPFKSSLFNEKEGNDIIRIRDLKTYHPQVRSPEIIEKMEYVQPGDVLVGMDAEFRPCIWKGNRGALNQRVCKITTKYDLSPCFAFFILEPYLNEIESYKTGTTVSHIGKSDFDNIRIVIPSIENLKKLSEIINPLYRLIVTNGCEIEVLTTTRNCLLPKLMSGEIDVSNLDLSN